VSEIYACGGGTRSALWLQIHADVCNVPIFLTEVEEASTLGTAICAAVAAGAYKTIEEAAQNMVHVREKICPDAEKHDLYNFFRNSCVRRSGERVQCRG